MNRFSFIGGTKRGYKLLSALIEKNYFPVFAFILKEDEHEKEKFSIKISELLKESGIPFQIRKKLSESDYKEIENSNSDFVIVFGWRTLIDTKVNSYLKTGLIASHFSLLPKYRGFAPVQWAIINGETESGVTLFLINDGEIDSGKIISQIKVPITSGDYSADVDLKMTEGAIELFLKLFNEIESSCITYKEQNEADATYTCRRIPEDGKIFWDKSSADIYNLIRAIAHPNPGAFCFFDGNKYIINKARTGDMNNKVFSGCIPGRVINIDNEGVEILCGSGTIKILEWENTNTGSVSIPNADIKSITVTLK